MTGAYLLGVKAMKKRFGVAAAAVITAFFALSALLSGGGAAGAAKEAIYAAATVYAPSIFPFLVLARFSLSSGMTAYLDRVLGGVTRLFRLPPEAAGTLVIGLLSGFPAGAVSADELRKRGDIDGVTDARLAAMANMPSPPFVITAVGAGMLGSVWKGVFIYAVTVVCSLAVGAAAFGEKKVKKGKAAEREFTLSAAVFTDAVKKGAETTFYVSAFIVFFAVILHSLEAAGVTAALSAVFGRPLAFGLFEMTAGIRELADAGRTSVSEAAAALSFSGLCVFFQTAAAVEAGGFPLKNYLIRRAAVAVLSFGAAYLLYPVFFSG